MQPTESVKSYLTDWKNLATHAFVGILLVFVIFVIPVEPIIRIAIFLGVVVFNMARMQYEKRHASSSEENEV